VIKIKYNKQQQPMAVKNLLSICKTQLKMMLVKIMNFIEKKHYETVHQQMNFG